MLFLEDAGHDATAPSGTRSGYAILRREDGSFCFYNPYAPSAEPLSLPDAQGVKHTLRPALPESIATSKPLIESGILNNAQTLLAADGTVRSIVVKSERHSVVSAGECDGGFGADAHLARLQWLADGVSAARERAPAGAAWKLSSFWKGRAAHRSP
jgi:hypothetical protein